MSNEDASTFLSRLMENLKINEKIDIPIRGDGSEYQVDHLAHD